MNFWLYDRIDQDNVLIDKFTNVLFKIKSYTDKECTDYYENAIKLLVRQKTEIQKLIENEIEELFMDEYAQPNEEYWGKHPPFPKAVKNAMLDEVKFISLLLECNFMEFSGF